MRVAGFLLCLCLFIGISSATNWALLVAGSKGWTNYRHQADVCHAYQILKGRGFPDDNIVVFMYDDIATDTKNPWPGKIFNSANGVDVYKGVKIDYKNKDVTPENFLNVLQGNKEAMKSIGTGRVIDSSEDDTIFVFYADHGGSETLSFPSDLLHASDLEKALRSMSQQKQFKQMLIYIEACEAGSMFDRILGEELNVLVSTASAKDEVSYAAYCNSQKMNYSCFGDMYSTTWMEHLEKAGLSAYKETLFEQYDYVRSRVNSHVQLYGNFKLGFLEVDTFFKSPKECIKDKSSTSSIISSEQTLELDSIPSRDIPLHMATKMYEHAPQSEKQIRQTELSQLIRKRQLGDKTFDDIIKGIVGDNAALIKTVNNARLNLNKRNVPCYKMLIKAFEDNCFIITQNDYILKHLYKFVNVCEIGKDLPAKVINITQSVCRGEHKAITNMV